MSQAMGQTNAAEGRRWLWQRLSAVVLALCVVVHLITMIVAVQGGLTAQEILGRTRGSFVWGGFYTMFVLAVAVHASIGLGNIFREWLGVSPKTAWLLVRFIAVLLLLTGLRAVWAVVVG